MPQICQSLYYCKSLKTINCYLNQLSETILGLLIHLKLDCLTLYCYDSSSEIIISDQCWNNFLSQTSIQFIHFSHVYYHPQNGMISPKIENKLIPMMNNNNKHPRIQFDEPRR